MTAKASNFNPTRQDTFTIGVKMGDTEWIGYWDKKTGGDVDSDELKYFPGGMVPSISLGGKVQPANIVLQRDYDGVRDNGIIQDLINGVGRASMTVNQQALDFDGNPYGKLITWIGILKRVTVPDVDSEANAAALIEIEITVSGSPVAA